MKCIHRTFPYVKFNTTMILTGDLIEKFISNEFSFTNFMQEYNTALFFKQPSEGSFSTKEELQSLLPNFFPTRRMFLMFLKKFSQENPELYDKLYNIKYRADLLYRNFNDNRQMVANQRVKNSKQETLVEAEAKQLACGHLASYAGYIDSKKCMICSNNAIY